MNSLFVFGINPIDCRYISCIPGIEHGLSFS